MRFFFTLLDVIDVGFDALLASLHCHNCRNNPNAGTVEWVVAAVYVTLVLLRVARLVVRWWRARRKP